MTVTTDGARAWPAKPPTTPSDLQSQFVGFTAALRAAGLTITTDRVTAYLTAVSLLGLADASSVYWAGCTTLCAGPDDVAIYDRAFVLWFFPAPAVPLDDTPPLTRQVGSQLPETSAGSDTAAEEDELRTSASETEVLRNHDIALLDAMEQEQLRRMLSLLRCDPPLRRTRRMRRSQRGVPDPRRTLAEALRNHGELVTLARRRRVQRPRKVVLLLDVSGSMDPYADALLHFAQVVVRSAPTSTEVFTLGTRLTRVTRELRLRDVEVAIARANQAVPDWAGGTRLGEALKVFLDRWGQRGVARRAVVVVFSDGWERLDTSLLAEQTQRLSRLAHLLVWVNPHAGKSGYEPVQRGIVAVLPHLDALLAGHSLATLEELLGIIRRS